MHKGYTCKMGLQEFESDSAFQSVNVCCMGRNVGPLSISHFLTLIKPSTGPPKGSRGDLVELISNVKLIVKRYNYDSL